MSHPGGDTPLELRDESAAPPATGASEGNASSQALPEFLCFPKLPREVRWMVIEACGSGFFTEDVRRLTVSREWTQIGLPAMYKGLSLSNVSFPFAPWKSVPELVAQGKYLEHIESCLNTHLNQIHFDLDHMFRRYQFLPEDSDHATVDLSDRREKANLRANRNEMKPFMAKRSPQDPSTIDLLVKMAITTMACAVDELKTVPSFELRIREPWGLHRRLCTSFEAQLFDFLGGSQLLSVRLDSAGLARRDNVWSRDVASQQYDVGPEVPIGLHPDTLWLMEVDNPSTMPDHNLHLGGFEMWYSCDRVRDILPKLEVLHLRSRRICPSIFRDDAAEYFQRFTDLYPEVVAQYPEAMGRFEARSSAHQTAAPPPLPKLKEVVINMILPKHGFKHDRVVHCCAGDTPLTADAVTRYSNLAYKEMKTEIVRFAKRLESPRRVILRYPHPLKGSHAIELDAVTGDERERLVDEWGEVTD